MSNINVEFKKNAEALAFSARLKSIIHGAENPEAIIAAFSGEKRLEGTLRAIDAMDQKCPDIESHMFRRFYGETAEAAGKRLVELTRKWDSGIRPSIPALARAWLKEFGIDETRPAAQLLMLVAARAEMVQGAPPAGALPDSSEPSYHNRTHYLQVFQNTCYLLWTQMELKDSGAALPDDRLFQASFENDDICEILTAAMGHDLGHSGRGNAKDPESGKPLRFWNEDVAISAIYPLMGGLYGHQKAKAPFQTIKSYIRFTDPASPYLDLKLGLANFRAGKQNTPNPDYEIKDNAVFWSSAAILIDADLLFSTGAGMDGNKINGEKLTEEAKKVGMDISFSTPAARKFFFDNIVGQDGLLSAAGRFVFNDTYQAMRQKTELELKCA